ncbi:hypothetical protein CRD_01216 [Raphidiopsis brookii D9]|nr:hypothetical protein CRD_01216 [Raphidiopsis brookii D9]
MILGGGIGSEAKAFGKAKGYADRATITQNRSH